MLVNGDIYLFVVKDFLYFRRLFAVRYTTNTNTQIYTHLHATKLVSSYDRTFLSSSDRGKIGFRLDLSLLDHNLTASNENNSRACIDIDVQHSAGECACVSGHMFAQPRGRWKVKTDFLVH